MAFEDSNGRWDNFLEFLHYLEIKGFTGTFYVNMFRGRISRSTLRSLRSRVRRIDAAEIPQQGVKEELSATT